MDRRHSLCRDDATISKYGNVPFLPGSSCFFPPTSLEPSKLASSLQLGPLRRPILRPIEANPANPSPPPKRRETRNFARDFDFVRSSKSVVESLEARCSAFHNHCSPILIHVFACREGAIRGERLCARSKDSLVVVLLSSWLSSNQKGKRSTIDRCARLDAFLRCGFHLPRLSFFFFFFIPPLTLILFLSTQGNVQGATTVQVASFVFRVWEGSNGVL